VSLLNLLERAVQTGNDHEKVSETAHCEIDYTKILNRSFIVGESLFNESDW
jgi:hypothetical protein